VIARKEDRRGARTARFKFVLIDSASLWRKGVSHAACFPATSRTEASRREARRRIAAGRVHWAISSPTSCAIRCGPGRTRRIPQDQGARRSGLQQAVRDDRATGLQEAACSTNSSKLHASAGTARAAWGFREWRARGSRTTPPSMLQKRAEAKGFGCTRAWPGSRPSLEADRDRLVRSQQSPRAMRGKTTRSGRADARSRRTEGPVSSFRQRTPGSGIAQENCRGFRAVREGGLSLEVKEGSASVTLVRQLRGPARGNGRGAARDSAEEARSAEMPVVA